MTGNGPTAGLHREQLANGVTLLVQRRRVAPAVTLATFVRAGFLDEPDSLVGISHVLEHMLFKGTPSIGPGELAQRTKALGGSLNAYTSYDRTVYFASAPARHVSELVPLQADQVRNPLLDAEELRRELGVIIQEANRKLDSPGAVAGETLHELLYESHRIRRWRIGTEAMLAKFNRNDVAGYHASRYVPARTIVVLVGDIDEAAALDEMRAQWSDWTRPPVDIAPGPAESGVPEVRARRLGGDVALGEVVLGWRAPGVLDAEIPALEVAAAILGLGRASRFGRLLREPGLVNAAGASTYGVVDAGVFSIGVELDPARLRPVLDVIGGALQELAEREPVAAEFDRAIAMLRARLGRRLERYESRALALGGAELLGDISRLDSEESDLLAVTPVLVRDAVRRWLTTDGVSAVAYLPQESDAPFDADLLRGAMGKSVIPSGTGTEALRPQGSSIAVSVEGTPSRAAFRAVAQHTVESPHAAVHHLRLDNVDILTARFGETGQTSLALYRQRTTFETPDTAGLAALSVRAMMRGTVRLDAAALAFAMEALGGGLSPSLSADLIGFGTAVLTERISAAAGLLAEVLHHPRFAPESIEIERALLIEDARAVADDMVRFPMQLALGVAFDHVGYGSPSLGSEASLRSVSDDAVRRWHAAMLAGGRTTVIAVGDADPEWLADALADVIPGGASEPFAASRSAASLGITAGTHTECRDRKQSALAMLFPGPGRRDPERFAAETWGAIAAGLGGRLFESLRSRRSLAYTVVASSWQRRHAGGMLTYIATDPVRLDEARAAMLEELAVFRREPPSAEELTRAVAMLAGQAEMSRQTAGSFAGEIADAWLLGFGLAELDEPAAPYRSVTAEAVHAVAARGLDPGSRAEGVVAAVATE